jgi:hypothetical protein
VSCLTVASSVAVSASRIPVTGNTDGQSGRRERAPVDDSQDLVEGLSLLSDALGDPATDLRAILDVLTTELAAAVSGYLGLTVAVQVAENPVVVTTLDVDAAADVTATLMLPLLPLAGITGSVISTAASPARSSPWCWTLGGSST